MIITFCGHGSISYSTEIKNKLKSIIEELINHGADEFLFGGYGSFDMLTAHIVYEFKEKYTQIRSILVIPYLNRDYCMDWYDDSIYPPLESVPNRFAIVKRNEWMVDKADIIVAYVEHNWGGAYKTLKYAMRKKKTIYRL